MKNLRFPGFLAALNFPLDKPGAVDNVLRGRLPDAGAGYAYRGRAGCRLV